MGQVKRARGVVHIHSAFSTDGSLSIDEIARRCIGRGLSFAALSDHAEDVDEAAMCRLVAACEGCSRNGFVLIPGLEHRLSERVHILALGQKQLFDAPDTIETLRTAAAEGCVLVASHCVGASDIPPRVLEILCAVEIWNVSRHTRFLPTRGGLTAYRWWSRVRPNLLAVGGLDMHSGREWGCEVVLGRDCEMTQEAILSELRAGQFRTKGRFTSFHSRPETGIRDDLIIAAGDMLAAIRDARDRVIR